METRAASPTIDILTDPQSSRSSRKLQKSADNSALQAIMDVNSTHGLLRIKCAELLVQNPLRRFSCKEQKQEERIASNQHHIVCELETHTMRIMILRATKQIIYIRVPYQSNKKTKLPQQIARSLAKQMHNVISIRGCQDNVNSLLLNLHRKYLFKMQKLDGRTAWNQHCKVKVLF
jgi:hypothetical protein